uniref:Uncharacterized protein n=1 Tax=Rhodnius prolixus TaxID=13249 RepID=T1I1Z8_RHOPR
MPVSSTIGYVNLRNVDLELKNITQGAPRKWCFRSYGKKWGRRARLRLGSLGVRHAYNNHRSFKRLWPTYALPAFQGLKPIGEWLLQNRNSYVRKRRWNYETMVPRPPDNYTCLAAAAARQERRRWRVAIWAQVNAERSGRPVEVTTPEIIDKIHDMVMDDRSVKASFYKILEFNNFEKLVSNKAQRHWLMKNTVQLWHRHHSSSLGRPASIKHIYKGLASEEYKAIMAWTSLSVTRMTLMSPVSIKHIYKGLASEEFSAIMAWTSLSVIRMILMSPVSNKAQRNWLVKNTVQLWHGHRSTTLG